MRKRKKKDPIDHLDDVDVVVDPKPLTEEEKAMLSAYFRTRKAKVSVKPKHYRNFEQAGTLNTGLAVRESTIRYKKTKTSVIGKSAKRTKAASRKKKK